LTAAAHHEQLRNDDRIGNRPSAAPTMNPVLPVLIMMMDGRREYSTAAITLGIHPDAVRTRQATVRVTVAGVLVALEVVLVTV
jgi:hypothetical protein